MIYFYKAKKGDLDRNLFDKWINDLINNKILSQQYKIWIVFWFIAKTYFTLNEIELSQEYHKKAKNSLNLFSKNISGEEDRKSFLNVYFNQLIMEDIKAETMKEDPVSVESMFAFCPSCGFKNENNFVFCPSCGNDLKQ